MDKNAIKKYAVWARRELIEKVSQKAMQYGIEDGKELDPKTESVNGILLTDIEKRQRQALIKRIRDIGYTQTIEEVSYTWFNRFVALRFMEVNGYLPSHVRVFTDENNNFNPQILGEALHLEFDVIDKDRIIQMKEQNEDDNLFKYLLISQCNELNKILPGLFQKIDDFTELLLPDFLLRTGSVIEQLITMIPENEWNDQVQIIGWMYQYYNTEANELVYDGTMSKKRIPKELLPAATTIYTPDWAIKYMVENSLGELWSEAHEEISNLKYFIKEKKNNVPSNIVEKYSNMSPEDIKCIDPCSGSGHILVYMFDVLIKIYESYGYTAKDAASVIVQKNIFGLDIDKRAAQLSSFAISMKARQYDRRFFSKGIEPNVYKVQESNSLTKDIIDYFAGSDEELCRDINGLINDMHDANELGSIIKVGKYNWNKLFNRLDEIKNDITLFTETVSTELEPVIKAGWILSMKYQIVVTNPPYLGSLRFSPILDAYVKEHYPDEKSDLSMVMFRKAMSDLSIADGFVSFITTSSWMYLSSFKKFRERMLSNTEIDSLVDFGTELFDGKVGHNPIVAWVCRNSRFNGGVTAIRLVDYCYAQRGQKEEEFFNKKNRYYTKKENFELIPESPIAYWVGEQMINAFSKGVSIDTISDFTGSQHITADNAKYLRTFWEVDANTIGQGKDWAFYAKGGEYRKWYGNIQLIVNTSPEAMSYYKHCPTANCLNERYWFKEGITYSAVTSGGTGFRYYPPVGAFDKGGPTICNLQHLRYVLGLLNSNIASYVFKIMNPTINLQVKDVKALPIILDESREDEIDAIVQENIEIVKTDWDSYEVSADFKKNPLIRDCTAISEAYEMWEKECKERFTKLKENEKRLNEIYIRIYDLDEEVSPEVDEKKISVRLADKKRDIKNFISYAVGCMFGRYSLDVEGVICSSNNLDTSKYKLFTPDKDNIVPITDDEYFNDDIVKRFVDFVEVVYGKENLQKNLMFISEALGGTKSPLESIREYFVDEFFKDHCSQFYVVNSGKKPIYWLIESGKKNGFKCLIYYNRYEKDLLAKVRTDYIHELQSRYRAIMEDIQHRIENSDGNSKVKLSKQMQKIIEQDEEVVKFEEVVHHYADMMIGINLEDGIKNNYELLSDVLAKIK